jgi:hypothetical protein
MNPLLTIGGRLLEPHRCGDGEGITYATSGCFGYSNPWIPSYAYLGCNNIPSYGVGFNAYNVETHFDLCPVWVPIWGTCVAHDYSWGSYRYYGNGDVYFVGAGLAKSDTGPQTGSHAENS